MNIVLMEPLGVAEETIDRMAAGLIDQGHEFITYDAVAADEAEMIDRAREAHVLIIANHPLPAPVIEAAENLKMISVAFVGVDHVGLDLCRDREIVISNAAGYCDDAVAELALGMTLNLLRNGKAADLATRQGETRTGIVGNELAGKTVGIIGTGNIGLRTAELFKAFKCKLIAYSRSVRQEAQDLGVTYKSLIEVMEESDIVSIHTPLTGATKGMISKDLIGRMKKDALLINVARGPIVDNQALADALNAGIIRGAGVDVFDMEPPLPADEPLHKAKNVWLAPHVAFATKESIERRAQIAFDNVSLWLDGRPQNVK
jgi:D-3-phosphoglycerate dehydrogenase